MKNYMIYCGLLILALCSACTSVATFDVEETGKHTCHLLLNVSKQGYDDEQTRVTSTWQDGDCIFLSLLNGADRIAGKAVYSAGDDYWTLYYDGQLSAGVASTCHAYYFDGEVYDGGNTLSCSPATCVFCDKDGAYRKTTDGVVVNLHLAPQYGRLRFKGEKGQHFSVSGVQHPDCYDKIKGSMESSSAAVDVTIGDDGYTPYMYLSFASDSRTLTVAYDGLSFKTDCEHPILDAGQSGRMTMPTKEKHNGWNMMETVKPTVGVTNVTDIGIAKASFASALISNGNGTVTDCGFCYSKVSSPTVNDMRVSYGPATDSFGKTVTGLSENTTYYVRAYAVNEAGTAYGEEASFKTLEVTVPLLSSVQVSDITNTAASLSATVTSTGNGTLMDAGFVYSTTPYPTLDSERLPCGKQTSLEAKAANLTPETKYYVRAYATNEKGTNYGEEKSFTTAKTVVNPYTTLTLETSYGYATLDMAKIESGKFIMGAQSKSSSQANYDKDAYADESPVHEVTLSSYYIGKAEVTQLQWYVVMGSYPALSSGYGLGDDYPVYNVTYEQCLQFIQKLNKLTGKTFRLPTEAEWEFAARGGNNSSGFKYSGSNTIGNVAWYNSNAGAKIHETGKKTANELNLYDMTGNVWEWCSDWYGNYTSASQTNPKGASSGTSRVIRGGGMSDTVVDSRVTVRSSAAPSFKSQTLGFRIVME